MGGVAWSSDNCRVKGKWPHTDRTALSPHLFSAKVLICLALGCRGETGTARDFPHSVCQPWHRAALWWGLTTAQGSTPRPPTMPYWTNVGTAEAGELNPRPFRAPLNSCCGDCLCVSISSLSFSTPISSRTDMNFSSFAALLLHLPYS